MMSELPKKKPRLEWLDAMRGFTMILVVANHVSQLAFHESLHHSTALQFLVLFRMPLFFFISGFLAHKASLCWDARTLLTMSARKARVQLLPTFVFLLLAIAVLYSSKGYWNGVVMIFHDSMKGGYWFTIALFYMLLAYYLFCFAEHQFRWKSWIPIAVLFVVSLVIYETCYMPRTFSWGFGHKPHEPKWLFYSSLYEALRFFPFFLYGSIVRRYWEQAQRIMDSRWFFPVMVFIVIFCTLDAVKWHTMKMEWANLPQTLAKFMLLTMVFMYFRHYHQYFTKMTIMGSSLQYIGRRTLDIYLIHFLFMPNLPGIGSFFGVYRYNFIVDTTLSVLMGLLVIAFSIITSNILRISPLFKKYLFGRG